MKNFFIALSLASLAALLVACSPSDTENPYPMSPFEVRPLMAGMGAPAFTVKDASGEPFQFDPTAQDAPTIIIFYRGGWCPYCNKHLMRLRDIEDEMLAMGFNALFISADSFETIQAMLSDQELSYTLLSDNEMTAATAFGLTYYVNDEMLAKLEEKGHDIQKESGRNHRLLPVPAVYMINTEGVIAFQYVNPNYKIRLEPSVILAAAKTMIEPSGDGD